MVTFALKGKEKGLKGKETQVNKGRVQDIYDSLTQVNKGRVQDICNSLTQVKEGRVKGICDLLTQVKEGRVKGICKSVTQVNKGRVQVRVVARVNKDRVHTTTSKTSFTSWKELKIYQVLQLRKRTEKPRKSVLPVGIGAKGQNTAKYQFSCGGERPKKSVSQVVRKELQTNIQRLACYQGVRTTQEISFSGRIGKESAGK